jgi:hypothetical protein
MENINSISREYVVCCFDKGITYNKHYNSITEAQSIIELLRKLNKKCWIIYPTHH